LESLKIKYPTKTTAINKLCLVTDLQAVVSKLNLMPITLGNQLLTDIDETCTNDKAICSHIADIDVRIIEAWEKINAAKSSGFRKDWLSLTNLKNLTTSEIQNLQGNLSLSELMTRNSRQPCNTCQVTSTTKNYLHPLKEYLLDLKHFSKLHNELGFEKVIATLKSPFLCRILEPQAYIIKVIKSENLDIKQMEQPKQNCRPDVVLEDGTICEFKSWRINPSDLKEENDVEEEDYLFNNTISSSYDKSKTQFENFKAGHTGVKKFIAYLSLNDVNNMNKLRYYFDAKKGATTTYVKNVFKKMMMQNNILTAQGNNVFNAIWGNAGLRESLFPRTDYDNNFDENQYKNASLLDFKTDITNTENEFYNFIKVK
jgi:hypothetical protein